MSQWRPTSPRRMLAALPLFAGSTIACSDTIDPSTLTFVSINAAGGYTCGVTAERDVYCWGFNLDGQRGDGLFTDRSLSPGPVSGGLTFQSLSAGHEHTCGLTLDGAAYCWGANHRGQIGDSTNVHRSVPTVVLGGLTFSSISAGTTAAVLTTGEGYCWGWGQFGELGADGVTSAATPTPVSGNLRFTSISVGGRHSCGIAVGGTLYCWGSNEKGQLGVGDGTNHPTPALVDAGLAFASVSAGTAHTCGITLDSTLYCWGRNLSGQLGDGTMDPSDRPRRIAGP